MNNINITKLLSEQGIYASLFDVSRIIEAESGNVLEIQGNTIVSTGNRCVDLLGAQDRCKTCICCRAVYSNEHATKLLYADGSIYLVMAIPLVYNEQQIVVELIKNVTNSIAFDIKDEGVETKASDAIDKFNKIAVTDSLTQLLNRRFIDERLPTLLKNSIIINRPVSVAMVDVDFFKQINDKYGHPAGDAVLRKLAEILSSFIRRESDFVARYGGEEFLFCFPGTPANTARFVCERVRVHIEKELFRWDDKEIKVTISIGVADSSEVADLTEEAIIELADQRLYKAKNLGRNKVV